MTAELSAPYASTSNVASTGPLRNPETTLQIAAVESAIMS